MPAEVAVLLFSTRRRIRSTLTRSPRCGVAGFSRSKNGYPSFVGRSSVFTHIGAASRAAGLLPIAMPFSVRNSIAAVDSEPPEPRLLPQAALA